MSRIVSKRIIAPKIISLKVDAPGVAKSVKPGQFVILMADESGERIPLTVADFDRKRGLVRLVFEVVGKTTAKLSRMNEGDELYSFVGPLGIPSKIGRYGIVVMVGGGLGNAAIHPIARELKEVGNRVISIIGARTKELLIMEEEMKRVSDELLVATNDGSYGVKGFVTNPLGEVLRREKDVKKVWAIGPPPMMKAVSDFTKPRGLETIVSLNAIMLDGTGMCGTCRVTVGGEMKFVCVDGPEFDGHQVDWDEFMNRMARYKEQEKVSYEAYKGEYGEMSG